MGASKINKAEWLYAIDGIRADLVYRIKKTKILGESGLEYLDEWAIDRLGKRLEAIEVAERIVLEEFKRKEEEMFVVSELMTQLAEKHKTLKRQILTQLTAIEELNPLWLIEVKKFLNTHGADVELAKITKSEGSQLRSWSCEPKMGAVIPPLPPMKSGVGE